MVGGKVIGLARRAESTLVHVQGIGGESRQSLSVRCEERRCDNGRRVAIETGDDIWWQSGKCYWTPKQRIERDISLPKIGYSH